ncbi:hypothetical protein Ddye_015880 [Dipteronia dyeriana]|uniref:Uncharacterized protein n=1 Tax=Dipteronia dyeriana TaxID=168575 RepID=A0AAD9WYY1_9ROSI|nr:hypothetical protein Ddye_015880 [Dipteronia dyeriana]
MGRQGGGDSTMVNSSIALLQERFRQLERVREKREEREMLKLFSESDRVVSPALRYEPNKLSSFQPEMILPHHSHRPPLQESLSLGLNYQDRHADFRAKTTPTSTSTSLWPNSPSGPSTSRSFDHSDVDTSLHL